MVDLRSPCSHGIAFVICQHHVAAQSINLRGPGFQSRLDHVLAVATDKSPSLPEPTFPHLKSGHSNDYLMWTLTASGAPTGGWGEVPADWPCSRTLPAPAGTEGCTRADTGLGSGVTRNTITVLTVKDRQGPRQREMVKVHSESGKCFREKKSGDLVENDPGSGQGSPL